MKTQKPFFKTCSLPVSREKGFVLVLDAGTTGIKAFVFDGGCRIVAKAYMRIKKTRPKSGWVEQNPMEILRVSKQVMKKAVAMSGVTVKDIRGVGITNQREAVVVWDARTGSSVYPVIGWEDTRTRAFCKNIRSRHGKEITDLTGLPVDAYFSASKIRWIMDRTKKDGVLSGTLDTWLLWNLCEGHPYLTDETNASRTLLFDIQHRAWSDRLLALFGVSRRVLPEVFPSRAFFGILKADLLGAPVPVLAMCGDQQASTYAAMRVQPERRRFVTKITYGTGVFVVQVLGKRFALHPPFFTTLIPSIGTGSSFALEAKIEGSGETVDRLLSDLQKRLAYFKKLIERVRKLLIALPARPQEIVVDGGIARDRHIIQMQEEALGLPSCLQSSYDGTALGCAMLVWDSLT